MGENPLQNFRHFDGLTHRRCSLERCDLLNTGCPAGAQAGSATGARAFPVCRRDGFSVLKNTARYFFKPYHIPPVKNFRVTLPGQKSLD